MTDHDLHRLADDGCPNHDDPVIRALPTRGNDGTRFTDEEVAFGQAIDEYKRRNHRPFPTWREVLAVVHALGYRLVAAPTELPRYRTHGNQATKG